MIENFKKKKHILVVIGRFVALGDENGPHGFR